MNNQKEELNSLTEKTEETVKAEAEEVKAEAEKAAEKAAKEAAPLAKKAEKAKKEKKKKEEKAPLAADGKAKKSDLKRPKDPPEAKTVTWTISVILALIAAAAVLLATSAINTKGGTPVPFIIAAAAFAVISLGFGIASFVLMKKNRSGIRFVPGAVTTILAILCFLAYAF